MFTSCDVLWESYRCCGRGECVRERGLVANLVMEEPRCCQSLWSVLTFHLFRHWVPGESLPTSCQTLTRIQAKKLHLNIYLEIKCKTVFFLPRSKVRAFYFLCSIEWHNCHSLTLLSVKEAIQCWAETENNCLEILHNKYLLYFKYLIFKL